MTSPCEPVSLSSNNVFEAKKLVSICIIPPFPLELAHSPFMIPTELDLCIKVGLTGIFSFKYIFFMSSIEIKYGSDLSKLSNKRFRLISPMISNKCCLRFLTPASYVYSFNIVINTHFCI